MSTPTEKNIKSMLVSQDNLGKIRSFLQIILCEIYLLQKREKLSQVGIENLRIISRETKRITGLLPGGPND